MRGDSLRDLYAKSIALLGLGLLGAIGAAVDYWPTGVAIPRTSVLDLRPEGLRPLAEGSLTDVTVDEIAPLRASTRVMVSATTSHPLTQRAAFKSVTFMPAKASTSAADLQMAPPESFSGLQAADATVDLSTLDWQPEVFQVTSIAPPDAPNPNQKGLFAGWGSSLVDGASKVGSTAANGLQAAGGAIKGGVLGLLHVGRRDDKQRRQTGAMLVENFPR